MIDVGNNEPGDGLNSTDLALLASLGGCGLHVSLRHWVEGDMACLNALSRHGGLCLPPIMLLDRCGMGEDVFTQRQSASGPPMSNFSPFDDLPTRPIVCSGYTANAADDLVRERINQFFALLASGVIKAVGVNCRTMQQMDIPQGLWTSPTADAYVSDACDYWNNDECVFQGITILQGEGQADCWAKNIKGSLKPKAYRAVFDLLKEQGLSHEDFNERGRKANWVRSNLTRLDMFSEDTLRKTLKEVIDASKTGV